MLLDEAVRAVNFIKSSPLTRRIFLVLCDEMGNIYIVSANATHGG